MNVSGSMMSAKAGKLNSGGVSLQNVASVSFLNAKPLIYGLANDPSSRLLLEVPSQLLPLLQTGLADVALLPVIDYQRCPGLCLVPVGGIGSDGPTLTVRLFSRCPMQRVTRLSCDTDSHTSVALARVILAERYGLKPQVVDLSQNIVDAETILLIGDKVISAEPADYPYQLDLGEAWKELTGLPFVFAVWMARAGVNLGTLPRRLEQARLAGMDHIEQIIAEHAPERLWPLDVARKYLTEYLRFEVGPPELSAIKRFYELARKHRVIDEVRPIAVYGA